MIEPTAFPERARRLRQAAAGLGASEVFPLLASAPLAPDRGGQLRGAVGDYLLATLAAAEPGRRFAPRADALGAYAAELDRLPNVTPNGLILPKRETCAAYGAVHAAVADIFAGAGLAARAEAVHAPVNIRLVAGAGDSARDSRPHATRKFHSDLWAGEPGDSIMVFLPVFEARRESGVHWIEPRAIPDEFLGPIADFDLGRHLIEGGTKYDADFVDGAIMLVDPYLIHATRTWGPGLRLSIDFRFIAADKTASDAKSPGTRRADYVAPDLWLDIGRGHALACSASIADRPIPEADTINRYADDFAIVAARSA